VNTQWLDTGGARLGEVARELAIRLESLSDPARLRRLKQGLCALAAVWLVFALVNLFWSLVPAPEADEQPADVLNPLVEPSQSGPRISVNIDELVQWNLFGTAATAPAPVVAEELASIADDDLDGVENTARETRLALTLQGVLSSSDSAEARAIIEAEKEQQLYLVGDELPVGNKVKVAKILSDRVVIDNGGKYELLMLFDEDDFAVSQSPSAGPSAVRKPVPTGRATSTSRRRGNADITQVAENYRRRLYSNPQSLAQVVKISAVREEGQLQGYRVSAGRDREQFEALGFKANDVVTGVNGIELTDPGKAIKLYEVMRTATQASFDVLRDGRSVTLEVALDAGDADAPPEGPEDE
jgi:general secretion pathway protein C